jgi:para-nitrobenzyl esterase
MNRSPKIPDYMRRGAFHADEVPYVFGTLAEGSNATENGVSDVMMDYWVNFVKTGNPNAKGLPHWTEFNEQEASVMEFKDGAHLVKLPNSSKLQLMEDHYRALRTLGEGK